MPDGKFCLISSKLVRCQGKDDQIVQLVLKTSNIYFQLHWSYMLGDGHV